MGNIEYIEDVESETLPSGERKSRALYRCYCGKKFETRKSNVASGHTSSCGCRRVKERTKHGLSNHKLYHVWGSMRRRCYNFKHKHFKDYGGRGISVCDEWFYGFLSFYKWAKSNGYKGGLQLDRIDNDGNYEPNNCRFVTAKTNCNNRRGDGYKKQLLDVLDVIERLEFEEGWDTKVEKVLEEIKGKIKI